MAAKANTRRIRDWRGYKQGRKRVLAIVAGILGQHLKTTGEPLVQPLMHRRSRSWLLRFM